NVDFGFGVFGQAAVAVGIAAATAVETFVEVGCYYNGFGLDLHLVRIFDMPIGAAPATCEALAVGGGNTREAFPPPLITPQRPPQRRRFLGVWLRSRNRRRRSRRRPDGHLECVPRF